VGDSDVGVHAFVPGPGWMLPTELPTSNDHAGWRISMYSFNILNSAEAVESCRPGSLRSRSREARRMRRYET
jgi:hypothetical protein